MLYAAPPPALLAPAALHAQAPAVYGVEFTTTKGTFVVTVHRSWAPRGADRFYNLVRAGFYSGDEFFRVVKGFVVQFGISGYPADGSADIEVANPGSGIPAMTSVPPFFPWPCVCADAGPSTRTTQVFINLGNNAANLDGQGFAPFGKVTSGMAVVQKLYGGYGEAVTQLQGEIATQGNAFLKKRFPRLDSVLRARVVRAH